MNHGYLLIRLARKYPKPWIKLNGVPKYITKLLLFLFPITKH